MPYLFIIGAEVLAEYIHRDPGMPSCFDKRTFSNVSQYAVDTTIITIRHGTIAKNVFDILNDIKCDIRLNCKSGKDPHITNWSLY